MNINIQTNKFDSIVESTQMSDTPIVSPMAAQPNK